MLTSYSIPLWLLCILIFLSVIAALDRILKPGVRWFLQRRVNTAIDELNARLDTRTSGLEDADLGIGGISDLVDAIRFLESLYVDRRHRPWCGG